jgi:hypothetical protein
MSRAIDRRHKDGEWWVGDEDGVVPTWERASLAVLMDIRDELKRLTSLLYCPSFTGIPRTLHRISANTSKPNKRKKP